jgi:acetyl-CoA C-acetyltransferase
MALDPRTPVLVGSGQVTSRPDPARPLAGRPEPVELMARALLAAAEDASGVAPGAAAPAGRALLERAASLRVVAMLGTRLPNPGLAVAGRLGIGPAEIGLTSVGGNMPQTLLHHSASAIARGQIDTVLVCGAEAVYTRGLARRSPGGTTALGWLEQDPAATDDPVPFGDGRDGVSAFEAARGVALPVSVYPLFENALRAAYGWDLDGHRARIGALWSSFSAVAAANPYAWLPEVRTPDQITVPSAGNRMVSFPYTKLCTANIQVDQGAAYILSSVAAARAAGVPEERWVFPLAGADAHDHWFVSERADLHSSPAIAAAGRAALALAGVGVDDLGPVDLYSCFPCAVQMAAAALGLPVDDPSRPLTVTGGLTFAGGPGNNYATHAIATVARQLRDAPGSVGLVTGLGWYATKHAVGVYGSRPPADGGRAGFAWRDVQAEVDAGPRVAVAEGATGPVTVETYTVGYGRDGAPERGIVACRTPSGGRTWGRVEDPGELTALVDAEGIGRTGTLGPDGRLALA